MSTFSRYWRMIFAASFVLASFSWAGDVDFRKGFSTVAAKARPAVVFIQVEKQVPMGAYPFFNNPYEFFGEGFFERFGGQGRQNRRQPQQMFKQMGQGSGFLISKDGYILTNTQVVGDVDKITVRLADGREFVAKRIGADSKTEVALIKIEGADFPSLAIGDPAKLEIGEWCIAIGNPFGLKETLTVGVVSAKGRNNIGITDYEDFIQTDAAINPGNSGGPLLNIDGEVVGINTAIYSRSGGYMGIGFAVPIDMAMQIKEQLATKGKVTRGFIGIAMNPGEVSQQMAESFGRKEAGGVLVADVTADSPAEKAGLKSGDIIVELNGKKVDDNLTFRKTIANMAPGSVIKLGVFREGKQRAINVTVGQFPDEQESRSGAAGDAESITSKIGLDVQDLDADLAGRLGYDGQKGVVITEVQSGSLAEEAGLKSGMLIVEVNRKDVANVRQFEAELRKVKSDNLLLRVKADGRTVFVNIKVN